VALETFPKLWDAHPNRHIAIFCSPMESRWQRSRATYSTKWDWNYSHTHAINIQTTPSTAVVCCVRLKQRKPTCVYLCDQQLYSILIFERLTEGCIMQPNKFCCILNASRAHVVHLLIRLHRHTHTQRFTQGGGHSADFRPISHANWRHRNSAPLRKYPLERISNC